MLMSFIQVQKKPGHNRPDFLRTFKNQTFEIGAVLTCSHAASSAVKRGEIVS